MGTKNLLVSPECHYHIRQVTVYSATPSIDDASLIKCFCSIVVGMNAGLLDSSNQECSVELKNESLFGGKGLASSYPFVFSVLKTAPGLNQTTTLG